MIFLEKRISLSVPKYKVQKEGYNLFSGHLDYLIGIDIMGYIPVEPSALVRQKKNRASTHKTLWLDDDGERFYFSPSSSAEHSRNLIKKMMEKGFEFRMYSDNFKWICTFSKDGDFVGVSNNDNEAICYAALKAHIEDE